MSTGTTLYAEGRRKCSVLELRMTPLTKSRFNALCDRRYAIVLGPFGGGSSSVELTAAVTEAGGLGSFGVNHLEPDAIADVARAIRAKTGGPYALNLWVPLAGEADARLDEAAFERALAPLRARYESLGLALPRRPERYAPIFEGQIEAVLAERPAAFSFVYGIPSPAILSAMRARGIVTFGTATNVDEARALEAAGVDAVVASGWEAGGHRVSFLHSASVSPTLSALVPQVTDAIRIPVIAAGGIADGRGIVAAFALGADAVQIGTAFLATDESTIAPAHKDAFASSLGRATVLTPVFTGRLARGLRTAIVDELSESRTTFPPYPIQNWLTAPLRRAAAAAGDVGAMGMWAGQNAPLARRMPATTLVRRLVMETEATLDRLAAGARNAREPAP